MDPNVKLHAIRVEVASHLEHGDADVNVLVESFRELDEWLSGGGFKPQPWRADSDDGAARRATVNDRVLAGPDAVAYKKSRQREQFTPLADLDEDVCQVCHETGGVDDPVGHFKNPAQLGAYVVAHGECGEVNGLELA